jgi:DNA processing protein
LAFIGRLVLEFIAMGEVEYWIGFSLIPGIGPRRMVELANYFGDVEKAWKAKLSDLRAAGLDSNLARTVILTRQKISLDKEGEKLARAGARAVIYHDDEYPCRLKEIYDFPPLLYVRGGSVSEDESFLTVVGSRLPSSYGRQVVREIVRELSASGITIISGLARGIDGEAHRVALEGGGRTLAVLGSGVDVIYPQENSGLADRIMHQGALISEFPLGTLPHPYNFPRRNRIMSGISSGTLVIEAGERSGSLITADFALEQGREVFAVPGSIFSSQSRGSNRLIQEGAKLVTNAGDILEELNLTSVARKQSQVIPQSNVEKTLLSHLSKEAVHIDELCHLSGLSIREVESTLAMMEIKGIVERTDGASYILR